MDPENPKKKRREKKGGVGDIENMVKVGKKKK